MPPPAETAPSPVLQPWARIPDPFWDGERTGALLRTAWSANAISEWTRAYTAYWRSPAETARISVVYYGTPIPREKKTGGAASKSVLPYPYIFCAARLAEYKGIDILAMAFAELRAAGSDVHLVLCGTDHSSGRLFGFLRRLGINDRVHWLGQRPYAEVLELIEDSLVFVLPSRRESFGGALIEAMAAGKAVVAARTGGIPELMRDGVDGILFEPQNPAALAAALRRVLEDSNLRESLGRSARERSEHFSWKSALEHYASSWSAHPLWKEGATVGLAVWDSDADQTALAYFDNMSRGLARRGQRFCLTLGRSRWDSPFRTELPGGVLYRLGLPEKTLLSWAGPLVVLAQLLWISRAENVSVWHFFLLRYRKLHALQWFTALTGGRPVVTLA